MVYCMRILFLTLVDFNSIMERNIYADLLREFRDQGHDVYIVSPMENNNRQNHIIREDNVTILKIKIGKMQKTNRLVKGISTILLEPVFIKQIKKYFFNISFDLIIYSTPPITLCQVVNYVKKRDNAVTYLLLKDIFPQNAIDLGILKKTGIYSGVYQYFKRKEAKLYRLSDHIGCMSEANVKYLLKHNSFIKKAHVLPNSIEPHEMIKSNEERSNIRETYNIPSDATVFVYGGNLGKPQGISFLNKCMEKNRAQTNRFFVICGSGTEYKKIEDFILRHNIKNVLLINGLKKEKYEELLSACDIGLIFLDSRFTIPNFPSRILSYMDMEMPVLAATDINTDIGKVIEDGKFGRWCQHGDLEMFSKITDEMIDSDLTEQGKNAKKYLLEHYTSNDSYKIMMNNLH